MKLFDPKDAVMILLDHQTGLLQTVKDIPLHELRANAAALAKLATLAQMPVITTASEPQGPNGPPIPEIARFAPAGTFVPRNGEISAWENPGFASTVRATGRKTLIMAGIWTSVCVAFPAIQARAEGYTVYAVIDASGDMSRTGAQAALHRLTQAGVVPVTTNVVLAEVLRTWYHPDAAKFAAIATDILPHYRAVAESHRAAQDSAPRLPDRAESEYGDAAHAA